MRRIRGKMGRRNVFWGWRSAGVVSVVAILVLGGWRSPGLGAAETAAESGTVETALLPQEPAPKDMLRRGLEGEILRAQERWREGFEAIDTPEKMVAYQERLRERFVAAIGGLPGELSADPDVVARRSPLNAKVVGTLERTGVGDTGDFYSPPTWKSTQPRLRSLDGDPNGDDMPTQSSEASVYRYRVEKIIFESQPGLYVTAAIFLPDETAYPAPWPGVVVSCGHSSEGKAMVGYQAGCALAAIHGIAAMIFDPIDQGERHQLLNEDGTAQLVGTSAHNLVGADSIPLGRNTARFEIWDGIRAIDYLQSRSDILADQIGCMGNSGGGTQTAYLMSLDPRIQAAAPACYLCSLYGLCRDKEGPQDAEQNIFGQLAFGMDHVDYCLMRTPKPTLMCTATDDFFPISMAWQSFRDAKRWYSRLGYGDRMELIEVPGPHGWSKTLREGSVRWMLRWLAGRDEEITEPDSLEKSVLTQKEIQCTPDGETLRLANAKSVYEFNAEYAAELAKERRTAWNTATLAVNLERVRKIAGVRPMAEIPEPTVVKEDMVQMNGRTVRRLLFQREDGALLPTLLFLPKTENVPENTGDVGESTQVSEGTAPLAVMLLCDAGKAAMVEVVQRDLADSLVLVPDLRGLGETQQSGQTYFQPTLHGGDGQDFYRAYLLGKNYVGMRTEDVLSLTTWFQREFSGNANVAVELRAVGPLCQTVGLHAAALSEGRLRADADEWVCGWDGGPRERAVLTNLVPGALTVYDLRTLRDTF